ncbi:hypothetical protein [Novosphingobium terrae]|uniref:hypothetical protein n=1 Tax=Novosphingobium terrae TaxID=2726189 RepID=UPI001981CE91|nr:hypothetical protein [Novosphingobium terrae]
MVSSVSGVTNSAYLTLTQAGVSKALAASSAASFSHTLTASAVRSQSVSAQANAKGAYPSTTPMATITVQMGLGGQLQQMQIDDSFFDPGHYKQGDPIAWMNTGTVSALQAYVGDRMNRFLAANGIPEAPAKITFAQYDNSIQIPSDYKYADQLREALANDPGMSKALTETHALSSQLAYYAQFDPLTKAWSHATSNADMDAITKLFSYLYTNPAPAPELEFLFGPNGSFSVSASGQPFDQYVLEAQKPKV